MKKSWLIVFVIVLLAELVAIQMGNVQWQFFFKPLIIPALTGYFINETKLVTSGFKKWILLALLFSWMGDVLLLFQEDNALFFLLGLSTFLLAHVFYIIFFHFIRVKENVKSNPWLLVLVVIYYAMLISLLSPYLNDMKLPVRIYGVIISFMLMLALHMLKIKNKRAGLWMMTGALLFVLSDSILAINKFFYSFEMAGIVIMLTYGLAQLFIVKGAVKYLNAGDIE